MSQAITTIVLPVAGKGTRLMPLTKDTPKSLVLLLDRPLLDYILEEAFLSGMKDVVLIMSPGFRDQFEEYLKEAGAKFPGLSFHLYEQHEPWGNGRAILEAYDLLKGKPFILRFPDDIIFSETPATQSLVALYGNHGQPVILLEPVPWESVSSYGVVGIHQSLASDLHHVSEVVEKPKMQERAAPSNLAVIGGYVITPKLLEYLKEAEKDAPQVLDGLLINVSFHRELKEGGVVLGWQLPFGRFDCGSLEGLARAEEFLKKKLNQ